MTCLVTSRDLACDLSWPVNQHASSLETLEGLVTSLSELWPPMTCQSAPITSGGGDMMVTTHVLICDFP